MNINQIEPLFGFEEKQAVIDYMSSGGWLAEYKKTAELEKMIAEYTRAKYCTMVTNGTVSLFCALKAYDIVRRLRICYCSIVGQQEQYWSCSDDSSPL